MDQHDFDLVNKLYSCVHRTYERDDRTVQVLALVSGPEESYFVCIWQDTCMTFCASLYEVAVAIDP